MKRTITIIVVVVAVVVAGFLFLRSRGQAAMAAQFGELQMVTLERGSLVATIGATGTVRANQSANLTWQVSGTVDEVLVAVGDQVSQGDLLATLVETSLSQNIILARADLVNAQNALENLQDGFDALALARAAEAVTTAEQVVENAESALYNAQNPADQTYIDQAEANLILAEDQLERVRDNYEKGKNSANAVVRATLQSQLAQAQQNYDNALRRYNNLVSGGDPLDISSAQADLELARAQLADAKDEYARLLAGPTPEDIAAAEARIAAAQATLNMAFIEAPFDATVSMVEPLPGDQISPGVVAFRLDDLSRLLVDVEISEIDINRIEIGQEVTLSFDAIAAQEYHGLVVGVDLVGTAVQGIVNFNVTIELLDADEKVRPGMTAGVNIVVAEFEDVLLLPNRAVRVQDGKRVVFVMGEMGLQPVEIVLGVSSETHSELVGGDLQAGDEIILNPPAVLEQNGPPMFVR